MFVGLTGGIGAGKSEALSAFARLGAATVSSDEVAHDVLRSDEVLRLAVDRWGEVVAPEGKIDRNEVARVVFEEPDELLWLESELHPRVGGRIAQWYTDLGPEVELAVAEVPLLFEAGMEGFFDATVCLTVDEETRRRRAGERGHHGVEERAGRQLSQEEKAARATYTVANDGSIAELQEKLSALIETLRNRDPEDGTG